MYKVLDYPTFFFALMPHLFDESYIPTQATPKATGYDVRSAASLVVSPGEYVKIPLGVRGFCPEGWWYEIKPRSSTFTKKSLHALYGTIDEDYEGQLVFAAQYLPSLTIQTEITENHWHGKVELQARSYIDEEDLTINQGDAVAQIIPVRREMMYAVKVTNETLDRLYAERGDSRGAGGFGSTDKK